MHPYKTNLGVTLEKQKLLQFKVNLRSFVTAFRSHNGLSEYRTDFYLDTKNHNQNNTTIATTNNDLYVRNNDEVPEVT